MAMAYKNGIDACLMHGQEHAVNADGHGTKAGGCPLL